MASKDTKKPDTTNLDPLDDDLDDLNFSADDFLPDEDTAKFRRKTPSQKVVGGILGIFRLPETLLAKIYRSSLVRSVLYRFEWYRDLADQAELGSIIEDTYGGPRGALSRIRRFIRGNLLFTALVACGIYLGGRAMLPMVFQTDSVRTALGREAFDTEGSSKQLSEAKKTAEEVLNRRTNLQEELLGCIFTDNTRDHIEAAIGDAGLLADDASIKAMSAARRYRARYVELDLEKKIQIADGRVARMRDELSAAIENAKNATRQVDAKTKRDRQANDEIRKELARLEAKNSTDIRVTNAIIRLRDELNASNQALQEGPSRDQVARLLEKFDEFSNALAGKQSASFVPVRVEEPYPQWYLAMINGSSDDAVDAARKFAERGLSRESGSFESDSPALVNDSVHRLTTLLEQASAAVHRIENAPDEALAELEQERRLINSQMGNLLGQNAVWVDHQPCLTEAGIALD